MGLFSRSLVKRRSDGTYIQTFPPHIPELLVELGRQLDSIIDSDDPDLRRLFPTAYPDDPEKDAGYQVLARGELVDARRQAIATVEATADSEILTEDELTAWMALVNDLRLVLGTKLDVSEDDEPTDWDDQDTVEQPLREVYEVLGVVLHEIVEALSSALPD